VASEGEIRQRFSQLEPWLDERSRRLWAAAESQAHGRGGVSLVARASGVSRRAIAVGLAELQKKRDVAQCARLPIRQKGGGRKKASLKDPALLLDLEKLLEPVTRGDAQSPLRWTCKSVRNLADELRAKGHEVSHMLVAELLHEQKYSLQANRKTKEGSSHPDRNAQFEHISAQAAEFLESGQPAISVDTRKKEQAGYPNNGRREWRPKGHQENVQAQDFAKQEDLPYGVYDLGQNAGWVSAGADHDTSAFAVESIRRWWNMMGREAYPAARQLLVTADSGGGNGSRVQLWKLELQKLADETGLEISVCHFPPGTSKWNCIEHRLLSFVTKNWRGQPLVSHEVIVSLIAATTTRTGLRVQSQLDIGHYPKGIKVGKKEFASIQIHQDTFHGEWNYAISPRS
jgi:hypothetical protein